MKGEMMIGNCGNRMSSSVMWAVVTSTVLGSLAWAGEPVKLDLPGKQIGVFLAISPKHGLAFVTRMIVPESGPVALSTVVVDTKTGKTIPTDISEHSRSILISPSHDLALGFSKSGGQWVYDLAARKTLRIEEGPAVEGRQFTQWWGSKIVYGQAHRKGRKVVMGPFRVVDGRTGKAVAFPDLYVIPLAGSPDGKQLVVYGLGKDATQPIQDMRARKKTAKSLPVIRVDAQGKELAREELKKESIPGLPHLPNRIRFDPTSRFLLNGTVAPKTVKTVHDAIRRGRRKLVNATISTADVLDLKTGKKRTMPTQAIGYIVGFDGRQMIQNALRMDRGEGPLAIGKLGEDSIAGITNVPVMSRSRSRVVQTPGGMMIYWIAPGTNMLHSLPVDKVTTRPWPAITPPKKPTDAVLKNLVSRAVGMSKAKFLKIVEQGQAKQGEVNQPLSLWLLTSAAPVKLKKTDLSLAKDPNPTKQIDAMLGGAIGRQVRQLCVVHSPKLYYQADQQTGRWGDHGDGGVPG